MKLRRLSLHGFKSFADRTELHFHEGITAIVGPNGCGKSNISDAIRWVLGEQRASAIRGAKMEEAIFQGTVERRPLNRAEVSLSFSNEEGRLALPQQDVEIRRVVFREGGSDYQLNRQPTRLRDILDLCRDTGLGANAYTVIEQGMVDSILSDRAEERRHLFEEAAGIGRYKDRRKGAQRKLENAETDLARLQDLVAEVESKVRSLARQRRRAEKYKALRARRLDLEVAVANAELERIQVSLQDATRQLATLTRDEPVTRAELSTLEAELERRRLESTEAARLRNAAGEQLETLHRRVAEREREIAVADERRAHAERRLVQIAEERAELQTRRAALQEELGTVESDRLGQAGVVQDLAHRVAQVQERQVVLRRQVTDVRRTDEEARAMEAELTRQIARLEAEAAGAESRAAEAEARFEHSREEQTQVETDLYRLDEQGDLFVQQTRILEDQRSEWTGRVDEAEVELVRLRDAELAVRQRLADADDRASRLSSRTAAIAALEREFHGFAPAVAAALGARQEIEGLQGPVADHLRLEGERAAAVEEALGAILQTLIVRDTTTAARLREWLAGREDLRGAVALLPEAALPELEALLDRMEFAGQPAGEPVIIGRHEKLLQLRAEAAAAVEERETLQAARAEAAARVAEAESDLRQLQQQVEAIELDLRRAQADEINRAGQRERVERARADLEQRCTELATLVKRARREGTAAQRERERVVERLANHRADWQHATEALTERESAWEEVRDEEAELRVAHARAEGTLAALDRRLSETAEQLQQADIRLGALDREQTEHRTTLAQIEGIRTGSGSDLEQLFALRDELAVEVRKLDEQLAAAGDHALALETRLRALRKTADERSELRHRLELQKADADAHRQRIRERLEAEWARPFASLAADARPVDGDQAALTAELEAVAGDIERLGPINMLAMEEYEEESERLTFLAAQRDDLVQARDDLLNAIRQINRTARELFSQTFESIRTNFAGTFRTLFEGGECDIRLEDPEDPLESPVEISASPLGKRTQRIHLLSGGERALTALALLFAIYLVKPSPFCVLDEVDAPLDEANIGRFITMLLRFKISTQFIVITHNPRTMESADWLYGVTMEEPGVSSIVGVRLDEVLTEVATGS